MSNLQNYFLPLKRSCLRSLGSAGEFQDGGGRTPCDTAKCQRYNQVIEDIWGCVYFSATIEVLS